MKSYVNRYMATCVKGLEFVVAAEVKDILGDVNNIRHTRGKVIFDCKQMNMDINLRCIDNLYKLLCAFHIGSHKSDLQDIDKYIRGIDSITTDKRIHHINSKATDKHFNDMELNVTDKHAVVVSASRSGRHAYSRHDVEDRVRNALVSTGRYIIGDNDSHEFAIRIDVTDDICTVYRQLTTSQLRFRDGFESVVGGIRPPIAHALVRLGDPKSDDVFYDPFCGAGTIAYERSYYKHKRIYASDVNHDVLEIARKNLGGSAITFLADATHTKMKDNGVNTVITNMPWGRQIEIDDIHGLYKGFLKELKRILATGGRAIILTDQVSTISSLCVEMKLNCVKMAELSLHGLHPCVFRITI